MGETSAEPRKPSQNVIKEDPGIAYLTRPYSMGLEKEKEILEEARKRLTTLIECDANDDEWYSRVTYHGVKVTAKKDGAFCIAKGTCDVPEGVTLEDVRVQMSAEFRNNFVVDRLFKRIDPMMLHMCKVTELEHKELLDETKKEELRILWGALYLAPLVSDRDFCFVQHTCETQCPVTGHTIYVSNSFSVELPDAAPDMEKTTGRIRATLRITGYVFRPHPTLEGRLSMCFLGQADPKGYLPTTVVNLASVSQALNAGRVRDIHTQAIAVKKEMKSEVAYPFDSYNLHRRGGSIFHAVPLVAPQEGAKTFFVRLRAHADYNVTVQMESTDEPFEVCAVNKDPVGEELVAGKEVTFGGKNLLDAVLQVTLKNEVNETPPVLSLQFVNHNWMKTWVVLPVNMPITMSEPSSPAEPTAATTEQ